MSPTKPLDVAVATRLLEPFGIVVTVPSGTAFAALDVDQLHAWVRDHKVLVLRGIGSLEKRELPGAARRLGPLCSFAFGAVNELRPDPAAKNYLYTNRAVPLHWDGAFIGKIPRYLFFHCIDAPEVDGGETIFVDTTRVWDVADDATRDRWRSLRFVYEAEKVVHYGGRFEARVVGRHPISGETVLRFAEPVDDLNPVTVWAEGLTPLESATVITELRRALTAESVVVAHAWESGDIVIADNHALLHGRRAFVGGERRHIRRVNVANPGRTWRDALRDAVRIRRPEFMVAEIPILLIPALLLVGARQLATTAFAELTLLFFLLFHFGDMINCLADRDLDAVYKTRLSEAIYGLGVRNVTWQIAATVAFALGLATHLAWTMARPEIFALVVFGLLLGAQYSVGPLRLKGKGAWQVATLWALIFLGPMALVARTVSTAWTWPLFALIACYGAVQEGIILINTAEDLPEDLEYGIETTAVSLGLRRCVGLALGLVGAGGLALMGLLAVMAARSHVHRGVALLPLAVAWTWVFGEIATVFVRVGAPSLREAVARLRPSARRMPLWITSTAWSTLWAAAWIGRGWVGR